MIRPSIDWVLDIPWSTTTEDRLDPVAAREVLDADHYDLDKVKDRIVEYLAVQKLKTQSLPRQSAEGATAGLPRQGADLSRRSAAGAQAEGPTGGLPRQSAQGATAGLTARIRGPILCFVGPPGVGKTSLGQSIARAMNRKFVRISLGGVRDEAEIRGHRRTYIGAIPGRIVQALKQAGAMNPGVMLHQIGKIHARIPGGSAAALP